MCMSVQARALSGDSGWLGSLVTENPWTSDCMLVCALRLFTVPEGSSVVSFSEG